MRRALLDSSRYVAVNPQTPGNHRPFYSAGLRGLTPDQQRILIAEGGKLHAELSNNIVIS